MVNIKLIPASLLLVCLLIPGYSQGFEDKGENCGKCHTLSVDETKALLKDYPFNILDVKPSPLKGLWEVDVEQKNRKGLVYVDFSKKYLFSGGLISIPDKGNLTQVRAEELNRIIVDVSQIPLKDALVMGNPKAKTRIIVFTDPDCPFCAKLHKELEIILKERKDIAFFLKLNPLPMHPEAKDKAKAILCEKSLKLLEQAYADQAAASQHNPNEGAPPVKKPFPKPKCETTVVDENIQLAQKLGISSLPSLVLPDGRVFPGYKDANTLLNLIGK